MKKRLQALCAGALMLFALAACRAPEPTPEGPAGPTPSAEPSQPGQSALFKAGTWLAVGGEGEQYYFFDADGATGQTVDTATGMGTAFAYERDGEAAVFHMGSADTDWPCTVTVTDGDHVTLTWTREGLAEQALTYCSPLGSNQFCFFSDGDLEEMALRDYEARTGETGLLAAFQGNGDGTVTLHLFKNLGDHNSTAAWYRVDRLTGRGVDLNSGEPVALANSPAELRIALASEQLLAQLGPYDAYIAHQSPYQSRVVLTARMELEDFAVVSLEETEEGQGDEYRITGELYAPGTLTPGKPLVVALEFPEVIPNLAVRYRDGSGQSKVCAFLDSGLDGTPLLLEVTVVQ